VRRALVGETVVQTETQLDADKWNELLGDGHTIGEANAPHAVLVFLDYQCPACRDFDVALANLLRKYPSELRVVLRHFPLRAIHPEAEQAAEAVECAGLKGFYRQYHEALFAVQDSLGVLDWSALAVRVGLKDTTEFNACMSERRTSERVLADLATAVGLGLRATPSVAINGVLYHQMPPLARLEKVIQGGPAVR
jgi:protein-disulfide isomerase